MYFIHRTMYFIYRTMYFIYRTMYFIYRSMHFIYRTMYFIYLRKRFKTQLSPVIGAGDFHGYTFQCDPGRAYVDDRLCQ